MSDAVLSLKDTTREFPTGMAANYYCPYCYVDVRQRVQLCLPPLSHARTLSLILCAHLSVRCLYSPLSRVYVCIFHAPSLAPLSITAHFLYCCLRRHPYRHSSLARAVKGRVKRAPHKYVHCSTCPCCPCCAVCLPVCAMS